VYAKKTVLILKNSNDLHRATKLFTPLGVKVSCSGERHLGAVVGTDEYKTKYVKSQVQSWVKSVEDLHKLIKIIIYQNHLLLTRTLIYTKTSDREYACSKAVTKQHVDLILSKNQSTDGIRKDELQTVKQELKNEKILAEKVAYKNVCDNLTLKGKRC
jgi:hypothetical protein